jgi:transcription initiation factor TFIIIB Brf1 subunit/transcription initiation factor TFIIB
MKYTKEVTEQLIKDYKAGVPVDQIADHLEVPQRSVIAKLSSMGVYEKKQYLNKRGELPVRKSEYVDKIAQHLDCAPEVLDSLEKVNKNVLRMIEQRLSNSNLE